MKAIKFKELHNGHGEIVYDEKAYTFNAGERAYEALFNMAQLADRGNIRDGMETRAAEILEYLCDSSALDDGEGAVPFAILLRELIAAHKSAADFSQLPFFGIFADLRDRFSAALEDVSPEEASDQDAVLEWFLNAGGPAYWGTLCDVPDVIDLHQLYMEMHAAGRSE